MLAEETRLKKNGVVVRVYEIQDGRAYIFNPEAFQKVNNGWESVKLSQLVPMDFPINSKEYISKTNNIHINPENVPIKKYFNFIIKGF